MAAVDRMPCDQSAAPEKIQSKRLQRGCRAKQAAEACGDASVAAPPRRRPVQARRKKQQGVADDASQHVATSFEYTFPHEIVKAHPESQEVPWAACVGVEHGSGVCEGILFVELPGETAVCVKAHNKIAAELFGTFVCDRLGICRPWIRIVHRTSEEGQLMLSTLSGNDLQTSARAGEASKWLENAPAFLVVEYINGKSFPSLTQTWAHSTFVCPRGELSEDGQGVLRELGSFIAMDMLLNNLERAPCIWQNGGHFGINNVSTCLGTTSQIKHAQYLDHVRSTARSVARAPLEEHPSFVRVRTFLKQGCVDGSSWLGFDIGSDGTVEVQRGFLSTIRRASNWITEEELELQKDKLVRLLASDLSPGCASETDLDLTFGCSTISLRICASVIEAFQDALAPECDAEENSNKSDAEDNSDREEEEALVKRKPSDESDRSDLYYNDSKPLLLEGVRDVRGSISDLSSPTTGEIRNFHGAQDASTGSTSSRNRFMIGQVPSDSRDVKGTFPDSDEVSTRGTEASSLPQDGTPIPILSALLGGAPRNSAADYWFSSSPLVGNRMYREKGRWWHVNCKVEESESLNKTDYHEDCETAESCSRISSESLDESYIASDGRRHSAIQVEVQQFEQAPARQKDDTPSKCADECAVVGPSLRVLANLSSHAEQVEPDEFQLDSNGMPCMDACVPERKTIEVLSSEELPGSPYHSRRSAQNKKRCRAARIFKSAMMRCRPNCNNVVQS